jgi:hypothetical protein
MMGTYAAEYLGTRLLDTGTKSNQAMLNGEQIVIKAAHKNTSSVGVTLNVLEHVQSIVAVLEDKGTSASNIHEYTIYKVSKDWYKKHMTPSRNSESASRTTRMVRCNLIRTHGEQIGKLTRVPF